MNPEPLLQHQILIDHVEMPMGLFDTHWRLLLVNKAGRAILHRLGVTQYVGQTFTQIASQLEFPLPFPPMQEAIQEPFELDLGELGQYLVRVTPALDEAQQVTNYAITAQNLTKERELYNTRRDLLHVISHDVGNIISLALGYAELMLEVQLSPQDEWLYRRRVYDALHRGKLLVRDVVELEHSKTSGQEIRKVFLLEEALQQVVHGMMGLVELRYQKLEYQQQDTALQLMGNMALVKQAIENIVSNAIKYTPDHGLITVQSFVDGQYAVIEIQDTGIGIPKAALTNLGQRFFRVESEATRGIQGTGLGLHLAMSVIHRHNGLLEIESEEGQGSLFRLRFPLYQEATQ